MIQISSNKQRNKSKLNEEIFSRSNFMINNSVVSIKSLIFKSWYIDDKNSNKRFKQNSFANANSLYSKASKPKQT